MSECPKCKGKIISVNGLFYQCENGHIDDSTLSMIVEVMKK